MSDSIHPLNMSDLRLLICSQHALDHERPQKELQMTSTQNKRFAKARRRAARMGVSGVPNIEGQCKTRGRTSRAWVRQVSGLFSPAECRSTFSGGTLTSTMWISPVGEALKENFPVLPKGKVCQCRVLSVSQESNPCPLLCNESNRMPMSPNKPVELNLSISSGSNRWALLQRCAPSPPQPLACQHPSQLPTC